MSEEYYATLWVGTTSTLTLVSDELKCAAFKVLTKVLERLGRRVYVGLVVVIGNSVQ